jgi:bacillolysin
MTGRESVNSAPRAAVVFGVCAVTLICGSAAQAGQGAAQPAGPMIQSLAEPGQGLTIRQVSPQTGLVTFASSADGGLLLPLAATASAEARAISFVNTYGRAFGLADSSQVRMTDVPQADALGLEHVRLEQVHQGVPVRAGELIVHLRGARAIAANGHTATDLPESVIAAIPSNSALAEARQVIEKQRPDAASDAQYSEPRLEILNRGLLSDSVNDGSRLAWYVEATGPALREFIWVDAEVGVVLLNFSQIADAKSRSVYTSNHTSTLPGSLLRTEGGAATGDTDADKAYDYAGITYDYYLTNHGRDSYDNAGSTIVSSVHYCAAGCPYNNAFWNGSQMVYGDGFASADDAVAHELTHAVTERSANLFYYVQSGALNESFSDIFGETVDLGDGVGNDAAGVRWKIGEDLPIGAIRDMMTPTIYSNPGKMSDSAYFVCSNQAYTNSGADRGGVHTNSGIPNHAYALMVDGGTYNGRTITGIGTTKSAKIEYRALTTYLTSGATFLDDYNALNQSCTDLIGTVGITAADCTQVANALLAVEMNATWACSGATAPPLACPSGSPSYISIEGFESSTGIWSATSTGAGSWVRTIGFAKTGTVSERGTDVSSISDHRLSMTSGVTLPAGARLYFDHAFEFENFGSSNYDGGVIEYSTDGGSTWNDAAGFIDGGQGYVGTVESAFGNPLAGRSAFVKSSFGYTASRLNLSSLAGQTVRFRFRIGTDSGVSSLGWFVDNVGIYSCATPPPLITSQPSSQTIASGATASLSVTASGSALSYQWYIGTTGNTGSSVGGATASTYTTPPLTITTRYWVRVSNAGGSADSNTATIAIAFTDSALTPGSSLIKLVHVTELRTRINGIRAARGLPPFSYTNPTLTAGSSVIKAIDITELRTALAQAYAAAGMPAPTYTDPTLTPGVSIVNAIDVTELRNAVVAIE